MGCGLSKPPQYERRQTNGDVVVDEDVQNNQRRQEAARRNKGESAMQSIMRVGSRKFMSVMIRDPNSGRTTKVRKETNEKAETYDHVHNIVNETLEAHNSDQNTNNGPNGAAAPKTNAAKNPLTQIAAPIANIATTNTHNRHRRTVGAVGLKNLGNTCFMNSSLQCLSHTIPLTDYFLGYDFKKEINHENFLGTKGELANAYARLMKEMWLGKKKSLAPSSFKSSLGRFAPQFEGYNQHDCQELLAFLLDGIHEDLNRVKKRPYIEDKDCDGTNDTKDSMDAWQNYLKRNKSIVVDLFQGQLRNTMKCCNAKKKNKDGTTGCGHINVKFEPFMYLSLPIQDSCQTLDDCLGLFCTEEHLSGADQWYCTKCKEHVDATKKFDLWMLPPILVVHLKRFRFNDHGVRSKLDKKMNFPVCNWSLSKFIKSSSGEESKDDEKYDLYAIANHYGGLGGGHYTAHAMNRFDNQWYEFNDSTCTRIDQSSLGSDKAAYCLFYNRMELEDNEEEEDSFRRAVVRRQSVSRPELWPHMQNAAVRKETTETKVDLRSSFRAFHKVSKKNVTQLDDIIVVEEDETSDEDVDETVVKAPLDDALVIEGASEEEDYDDDDNIEDKKESSGIVPLGEASS